MAECVNLLSQKYGEKCRVIKDQGDYEYIIRVRFGEIQVQVSIPKIMNGHNFDVHVRGGPDKTRKDLEAYLHGNQSLADNISDMVLNLYKSVEGWLSANNFDQDTCKHESPAKKPAKPKGRKSSRNGSNHMVEEGLQKKAGMKTAEDVIKRLKWDKSLPADHFTVGYLDRFIGIVEKPFMAFNWEDLVNADITDLAIPQHRVQYFCYKKTKVWDKAERLDLIFNSTGPGLSIYDVIRSEDQESGMEPANEDEPYLETEPSDEEPEPVCGPSTTTAEDVPKGVRPDYFLAVPIDDPVLRKRVSMVKDSFGSQYPQVIKTFMDLDHLHVTVALFCTGDCPNGIEDIKTALKNEQDSINRLYSQIQFRGLNLLADRVLCSFPEESFKKTVLEPLKEIFNKYNVKFYMPSVPHLTIGKLNLSKDPQNSDSVKNLVNASRFNGTHAVTKFTLRPVGVKTTEEIVFSMEI